MHTLGKPRIAELQAAVLGRSGASRRTVLPRAHVESTRQYL